MAVECPTRGLEDSEREAAGKGIPWIRRRSSRGEGEEEKGAKRGRGVSPLGRRLLYTGLQLFYGCRNDASEQDVRRKQGKLYDWSQKHNVKFIYSTTYASQVQGF